MGPVVKLPEQAAGLTMQVPALAMSNMDEVRIAPAIMTTVGPESGGDGDEQTGAAS